MSKGQTVIPELITLFRNEDYVELLRHNLPRACEVADAESLRVQQRKGGQTYESVGQEVGVVSPPPPPRY